MSNKGLARLRERKKPVSKRVPIITDSDLAEEAERLQQKALVARERSDRFRSDLDLRTAADEAEADAEAAMEAAVESAVWFVAQSLSPRAYEDLKNAHPPTPEQIKDFRKVVPLGTLQFNIETFPHALIAACVSYVDVDPETGDETLVPLTESFVKEMLEGTDWSPGDVDILAQAASNANNVRRTGDVGKGSRLIRN